MEFSYKLPIEFELYKKAGEAIKEIMRTNSLTVGGLAQRLKDEGVFQSYNTAKRFVIDTRNGYFGLLIGNAVRKNELKIKDNLEKLAILFSIVGIGPNDEAVEIIKNANPNFSYPLKKD